MKISSSNSIVTCDVNKNTLQTHHEYPTLKRPFPRRFNVEYTWCVRRVRGSHLARKVTSKCLDVREWMEEVERIKDSPLPSLDVPWIFSVCKVKILIKNKCLIRDHSKRTSLQKWLFSDPLPPCHHLPIIGLPLSPCDWANVDKLSLRIQGPWKPSVGH